MKLFAVSMAVTLAVFLTLQTTRPESKPPIDPTGPPGLPNFALNPHGETCGCDAFVLNYGQRRITPLERSIVKFPYVCSRGHRSDES